MSLFRICKHLAGLSINARDMAFIVIISKSCIFPCIVDLDLEVKDKILYLRMNALSNAIVWNKPYLNILKNCLRYRH